jgi:hypothetical protein
MKWCVSYKTMKPEESHTTDVVTQDSNVSEVDIRDFGNPEKHIFHYDGHLHLTVLHDRRGIVCPTDLQAAEPLASSQVDGSILWPCFALGACFMADKSRFRLLASALAMLPFSLL